MKRLTIILILLLVGIILSGCNSKIDLNNSKEYDYFLIGEDGYNLVIKTEDGIDKIGVVDNNARWLHSLSENHIFVENGKVYQCYTDDSIHITASSSGGFYETNISSEAKRINDIKEGINYLGEGMFECIYQTDPRKIMLYNAKSNTGYDIGTFIREYEPKDTTNGETWYDFAKFSDGYLIGYDGTYEDSHLKIISVTGTSYTLPIEKGEDLYSSVIWPGRNLANPNVIMPRNNDMILTQCKNGKFSFRGVEYNLTDYINK